jgi:dihydrofolate reductase
MTRIRGYIATSLDGYIAGPDHDLSFLDPYSTDETGYPAFIAEIGTVVMGRLTYEVVLGLGPWYYEGKRAIIVSSRDVPLPYPGVEIWRDGVDALIEELRGSKVPGDAWVVGGGALQLAFLDRDAMDRLEIYVTPDILGDGTPLFPKGGRRQTLKLAGVQRMGEIAQLVYERP